MALSGLSVLMCEGCYTTRLVLLEFFWWEPLLDRRVRSSHFRVSLSFGHQVRLCAVGPQSSPPLATSRPESPRLWQSRYHPITRAHAVMSQLSIKVVWQPACLGMPSRETVAEQLS